jgi:hypothetical protein
VKAQLDIRALESGTHATAERRLEPDGLAQFQPRLQQVVKEVEQADLRKFRSLSQERPWQQLVARATLPLALRLTQEARALVAEITDACEALRCAAKPIKSSPSLPPAFLSFERVMDEAVQSIAPASASALSVDDVAFLVQMELGQREERLRRATAASEPLTVIGECDSALRRIRKGLGAVDATIAALEGTSPSIEFASELEESLKVRRAYGRVRAYFAARAEPTGAQLELNLRCAMARIGALVDGEVASLLRVGDRLQLLVLQERVSSWLSSRHTPDHSAAGLLWQDLLTFVGMLALINRRQELIEHDRKTLGALLDSRGSLMANERVQLLRSLEGLDPILDDALQSGEPPWEVSDILPKVAERFGVKDAGQ